MGILFFAPAAAEGVREKRGGSEAALKEPVAGTVAARRLLPVCERKVRRLTAFFFEPASIQATPEAVDVNVYNPVEIIPFSGQGASYEMAVGNRFTSERRKPRKP